MQLMRLLAINSVHPVPGLRSSGYACPCALAAAATLAVCKYSCTCTTAGVLHCSYTIAILVVVLWCGARRSELSKLLCGSTEPTMFKIGI